MSRPDLAEIISAVLAELDQAPAGTLARGPGGRPEVPMRRIADADPPPVGAAGGAGAVSPTTSATGQPATAVGDTAAATPPVTVAEATACSPRRRAEREGPSAGDDERSEVVERIVADLERRLGEPARG
ncbi:MAG: hypothetical protein R6V28_02150 [Nitriliruptoraceae bacterium]